MLGAVDDLFAVVGPERTAIVAQFVGELLYVGAIGIHGEDIEVAIARGSENDLLAVARNGGFGVVAALGQQTDVASVGLRRVDRVAIVNRPNVAERIVGWRRASGICRKSGGIKHAVARRKEIAARGAARAVADGPGSGWLAAGSIDGDRKNLIA